MLDSIFPIFASSNFEKTTEFFNLSDFGGHLDMKKNDTLFLFATRWNCISLGLLLSVHRPTGL
jgi:hypothetical protein